MTHPDPSPPGIAALPPRAAGRRARTSGRRPAGERAPVLAVLTRAGELLVFVLVLVVPCLLAAGVATGLVLWLLTG
ncbi:hypothetical protein ACFV1W_23075 [Kitasatospora sp. NPDC059648]|uniref:hypothetical protein n=1 Tax=Kitasatospora sp. NPDC059648 TaxID=3346894 RepID=UPI0036B9C0DB